MLVRNCAGGVVFKDGQALIVQNDKGEWSLPKGKIIGDDLATETAVKRVKKETDVDADIVSAAGDTAYEFYSISREQPVCNKITWFIMEADEAKSAVQQDEGIYKAGFYPIDEAIEMITYSQDKSLLSLSYKKYEEFKEYRDSLDE